MSTTPPVRQQTQPPRGPSTGSTATVPTEQHDHLELCQLRPAWWNDILGTHGETLLPRLPDEEESAYLKRALPPIFTGEGAAWIHEAIATIYALGVHRQGVDCLEEACQRHGVATAPAEGAHADGRDETAHEFVARIWCKAQTDAAATQAFTEARVIASDSGTQAFEAFQAREAPRKAWDPSWTREIEGKTRESLISRRLPDFVECTYVTNGNALIIKIVHGKRPLVMFDTRPTGTHMLRVRPATCDLIKFDTAKGTLQISNASAPLTRLYLGLIGRLFYNDHSHFSGFALNLRQVLNQGSLERAAQNNHRLHRVVLRCIELIDGDGLQVRIRGRRNLHDYLRNKALGSPKSVLSAHLDLHIANSDGKIEQYQVRLKGDHGVRMNRRSPYEVDADEFLWNAGIYRKATTDTDLENWWNQSPWILSEADWTFIMKGKSPRPYVDNGILEPVVPDMLPINGNGGALHPVVRAGETSFIVPESGSQSAVAATPTQLSALRWNPDVQARHLSALLELEGARAGMDGDGAIDLGNRDLGSGQAVRVILLTRRITEDPNAIDRIVRQYQRNGMLVGIVPPETPRMAALKTVPCRLPEVSGDLLFQAILEESGLHADPLVAAPKTARLVVTSSPIPRVHWRREDDGRLHELTLNESAMSTLRTLWESYPEPVPAKRLEGNGGRSAGQLIQTLRNQLEGNAHFDGEAKQVVFNRRGDGYVLSVPVYPVPARPSNA